MQGCNDITDALPCPFCGGTELRITDWCTDDGEFDAIECSACLGSAPATIWNSRSESARTDRPHDPVA